MTLSIDFSPELEAMLQARAAASGKDLNTFVREAVEEKLRMPRTFSELLAPIHEATRRSGLDEGEIAALVAECREEAYAEQQRKPRA